MTSYASIRYDINIYYKHIDIYIITIYIIIYTIII